MRIALIAPSFFGYKDDITAAAAEAGHSVQSYSDRPSEGVFFKSVGRINYALLDPVIRRYFEELCAALKQMKPDVLLVVGGMSFCFSREQVERLNQVTGAKLLAYLWDSLENCQRIGDSIDLFDQVFSFEPTDCEDGRVKFLPLFYSDAYGEIPLNPSSGFEYDACFVGSVHQVSKFAYVKAVIDELRTQGANVFTHYYMPSRSVELLRKMQNGIYREADLTRKTLSKTQVVELYAKTKTIVDAPQSGQRGLTMRTIECIGSQRKLITANPDVMIYDFYKYGQVRYLPAGQAPSKEFAESMPQEIPNDVKIEYSIHSWLKKILEAAE